MINTEKSKPHKQTTRTITNAAMLVLLRRLFRDALKFCAFEIFGNERQPSRGTENDWFASETNFLKKKLSCKPKNRALICVSRRSINSQIVNSYNKQLLQLSIS